MSSSLQPAQSFRSQLSPVLRIYMRVVVAFLALGLILELVAQYRGDRWLDVGGLLTTAMPLLAIGVVLAVILVLAVLAFPVKVLPHGLHCYNFWGVYRTVKWGDIVAVKPASWAKLPYLHVSIPAHSLPLTVPLWLRDMPGFIAAVETHAGPTNVLTVALRNAVAPASPLMATEAAAADAHNSTPG